MPVNLGQLEKKLGVHFKNQRLLTEALTHRSYLNERPDWPENHNERLEYLGDAVIELSISEALFRRFPQHPEGQLTVLRAALVNYQMLAKVAGAFSLDKYVFMAKGESRDTGKAREVILANAFEAVIGAIYLDQGFKKAEEVLKTILLPHLEEVLKTKSYKDPKSELQEIIQEKLKLTPTYQVLDEQGPAHQRTFRIGVFFEKKLMAEGVGSSKQEAETEAARNALKRYR